MFGKKSVLGILTALAGIAVLTVLGVLFCFTETDLPAGVYAAAWFSCLGAMLAASSRIYR